MADTPSPTSKPSFKERFCEPNEQPDFKLIVDRTVAVFAVYTGATLSFYLKDFLFTKDNLANHAKLWDWAGYWGTWVVFAVVALLLRYIIGSAVHLNRTYVPKETQEIKTENGKQIIVVTKTYRSTSLCWLFFDMVFLIAFGVLAFFITAANDINDLMRQAILFMVAGVLWSLVALFFRQHDEAIATEWLWIDCIQIVLTLVLFFLPLSPLWKAIPLALVYLACSFADLRVLARPTS